MFCVFPEPVKFKAWFYCSPIWEWYVHTGLVFRILLGSPLAHAIAAATLAGVLYRSVDENTEHWWSDWVSWKSFFQASDICNLHGGKVSSWGDGMPNPNMHWGGMKGKSWSGMREGHWVVKWPPKMMKERDKGSQTLPYKPRRRWANCAMGLWDSWSWPVVTLWDFIVLI